MLRIAQGATAGIAAGVIAGIGARIAMRLVALGVADGVGITPDFTVAGSLAILVVGAVAGTAFGALYALVEPRLPGATRLHGVVYAAVLFLLVGPLFFTTEEFFSSGRIALFTALFLVFGVAVGISLPIVERMVPTMPEVIQRLLAALALGAGALVLLGLAGIAGEAFERHGATTLLSAIPWLALLAVAAPALRARLSRLQVAR